MAGQDRVRANVTATAAAVGDGNTTETVVLTSNKVSTPGPGATITLLGAIDVTIGAASTAVTVRVRRSSLTGTLVGVAMLQTGAAGSSETVALVFVDTPGDVDGMVYVVTTQETGAGAAGTVNFVSLQAIIS